LYGEGGLISKNWMIEKCCSAQVKPKIVGELNGQHVKLVKLEGDKCPWHSHDREDEMFLILEGTIEIEFREGSVTVGAGEFYIVPKGVEHSG
jgi:mannose-6-phosphate isomerase-like protein (cupin superfamily)